MRKEARVLASLLGTPVPHPKLIAACDDEAVLGAAFYLMEPVSGFNPAVGLPELHASDPSVRRRMGFAAAEALASLGEVDAVNAGLSDLGKPDGFLERQVDRWRKQLDGYAAFTGWPGPTSFEGLDNVARWLESEKPRSYTPGLMHGDFHLANVMYCHDSAEVAAIVDWELATLGDPLIDLGWVLAMWPTDPSSEEALVRPWDGFPTADEFVAHYSSRSARDLSAMNWYRVFALYKLGIILEGTYARACAGKASPETGEKLHRHALSLLRRAHEVVSN